MFKKKGPNTGLGDKLGCYLMYSTLGYLKNIKIYTTWFDGRMQFGMDNDNSGELIKKFLIIYIFQII